MTIIGADSGLRNLGWAIWNTAPDYCLVTVAVGYFKTTPRDGDFSARLKWLLMMFKPLLRFDDPEGVVLAIETQHIQYDDNGGKGKSVLQVAQVTGAIRGVAETLGIPVVDVSPQRAKLALAGKGDATKEEMLAAVERQYGIHLAKGAHHAADALGMALAGASERRFRDLCAPVAGMKFGTPGGERPHPAAVAAWAAMAQRTAGQVHTDRQPAARPGVKQRVIG